MQNIKKGGESEKISDRIKIMSHMSFSPKEVVDNIVELGKVKIQKKASTLILQSIMAGMFIAFGAIAFINIYSVTSDAGIGLFLASAVFPVGIMAILLLGFELFTSNTLGFIGVYDKAYRTSKLVKMLLIVWTANLAGAVVAALLAYYANVFTPEMAATANAIGEAKVNMPFVEMFLRAVICNMLVCTGVMMALTAKDNISKMAAIWLPIVVFILCRAEHIVANMFFIPMAYLTGANISILDIIYSFFFVTVGNLVGGAVIVGGFSYLTQVKGQNDI